MQLSAGVECVVRSADRNTIHRFAIKGDQLLTATGNQGRVVYPVVKVSVEGVL